MQTEAPIMTISRKQLIAGRAITTLVAAFMLFDSIIKLIVIPPVVESFARLGWPASVAVGIGLLELAILTLYLVPRTSILGAILLTGLLGGAVATHLRVGDPLFSHILFGVYVGGLAWAALLLRNRRLRALIPLQR